MDLDIKSSIGTAKDQLPRIRRTTTLDDIRKKVPPKPQIYIQKETPKVQVLPGQVKTVSPAKQRYSVLFFILLFIFVGVVFFELAVIYRYDKLNKRLYEISLSLKNKTAFLQDKLQYKNGIAGKLAESRLNLFRNYIDLQSNYRILQYDLAGYEKALLSRSSRINLLEGELRVANVRIDALAVQKDLLSSEITERDVYIKELTDKLLNNLNAQESLLNENLRIKEENEGLQKQMRMLERKMAVQAAEAENVNK